MLKKLLTFVLVVLGAVTLAGCNPTDDGPTTQEVLEMINEAVDALAIPSTTSEDLVLPTTEVNEVEITWESSDTDVIANDGTVTRPMNYEGDKDVTLTAYVSLMDQTLTQTFEVTVLAADEVTDLDKVMLAKQALLLPVTGIVSSSFTLPATGANGTTVTWSSGNTEVVTDDGTVTQPAAGEGNASVTLTATITLNDASTTKEFDIIVAEEAATNAYTVVANIVTETLGNTVSFQGTVSGLFDGGYFLTDGTNAFGVYNPSSSLDLTIGDEVYVKGLYAKYNTLFQISDVIEEEIVTAGDGTNDLAPIEKTVAEVLALDSSDPLVHGMIYRVSGTLVEGQNADGYDSLFIEDGDDKLLFYYSSLSDSLDALYDKVGVKVTVDIIYYTEHSRNGVLIAFDGTTDDIMDAPLTDAEAVVADQDANPVAPSVAVATITLPTTGNNGSTYSGWTSSNTDVFADDGTFVARATETVTVTFTGTATKGTETATATFEVVVPINSNAAEVSAMEVGSYFEVTGYVYEEAHYGFYITSGDGFLFVYAGSSFTDDDDTANDYLTSDDLAPGDEITILGYLGAYGGLLQANPIEYDIDETADAAYPTIIDGTVEGINSGAVLKGQPVTITGEVVLEGDYDDAVIYGATGDKVKVYYRSNADDVAALEGKVITLTVIPYQDGSVLFNGVAADITEVAADASTYTYPDAGIAQALADALELPDYVTGNLDLPTANTDPAATMAWASTNEAVIATDGTVSMVNGSETAVTLTVTVTVGTETVTRTFDVTVADANDVEQPDTVTDVLADYAAAVAADTDPIDVFVVGVVTGFDKDGNAQIQDPDGTALSLYDWSDVLQANIGDEVVLRGSVDIYDDTIQLESWELVEIRSTGNTVYVQPSVNALTLANNTSDYASERLIMNLKVIEYDDGFGYIVFEGSATKDIVMKASDWAPYIELFALNTTLRFEFNVNKVDYYGNVRIGAVTPMFLDAQNVVVAEHYADFDGVTTTGDLDLPTTLEDFDAVITWASSDETVIATDGTVTQPAEGEADATVTLTATVTVDDQTSTVTSTVTVPAYVNLSEIYISEYIEGGSSNKAVELYNPNTVPVTLTGYEILLYSNGGTSPSQTLDLSDVTIAAGDVYVIYNSSAVAAIADEGDVVSNITYFNGNDALELVNNGTVVDVIGVVGEDIYWTVGTGSTQNNTLVRNSGAPNATWTPGEWDVYDQDTFDYIGSHTE
ncbi:MAG: lamin tail domain-containing protein [Candidatus Izimaplasma sp.]|nr:lamin tail domain-containing protein [Candidatus Izimaplasma bacterium]